MAEFLISAFNLTRFSKYNQLLESLSRISNFFESIPEFREALVKEESRLIEALYGLQEQERRRRPTTDSNRQLRRDGIVAIPLPDYLKFKELIRRNKEVELTIQTYGFPDPTHGKIKILLLTKSSLDTARSPILSWWDKHPYGHTHPWNSLLEPTFIFSEPSREDIEHAVFFWQRDSSKEFILVPSPQGISKLWVYEGVWNVSKDEQAIKEKLAELGITIPEENRRAEVRGQDYRKFVLAGLTGAALKRTQAPVVIRDLGRQGTHEGFNLSHVNLDRTQFRIHFLQFLFHPVQAALYTFKAFPKRAELRLQVFQDNTPLALAGVLGFFSRSLGHGRKISRAPQDVNYPFRNIFMHEKQSSRRAEVRGGEGVVITRKNAKEFLQPRLYIRHVQEGVGRIIWVEGSLRGKKPLEIKVAFLSPKGLQQVKGFTAWSLFPPKGSPAEAFFYRATEAESEDYRNRESQAVQERWKREKEKEAERQKVRPLVQEQQARATPYGSPYVAGFANVLSPGYVEKFKQGVADRARGDYYLGDASILERKIIYELLGSKLFPKPHHSEKSAQILLDRRKKQFIATLKPMLDENGRLSEAAVASVEEKILKWRQFRDPVTNKEATLEDIRRWIRNAIPIVERILEREVERLKLEDQIPIRSPLPRSEVRSEPEALYELLLLLARNHWLFEREDWSLGGERGPYWDFSAFEFQRGAPNLDGVKRWYEEGRAEEKKRYIREIVSHRMAVGLLNQLRSYHEEDEPRLFELLNELNIPIDTDQPKAWNRFIPDDKMREEHQRLRKALPKVQALAREGFHVWAINSKEMYPVNFRSHYLHALRTKRFVRSLAQEKNPLTQITGLEPSSIAHELVYNLLDHGDGGAFGVKLVSREDGKTVEMKAWDSGPGIENPEELRQASIAKRMTEQGHGFRYLGEVPGSVIIQSMGRRWSRDETDVFHDRGPGEILEGNGTEIIVQVPVRAEVRAGEKKSLLAPEEVAQSYRAVGYFRTLRRFKIKSGDYYYLIHRYVPEKKEYRKDYFALNYQEARYLVRNRHQIRTPYGILNSKQTAINLTLATLDTIPGFKWARERKDLRQMTELYWKHVRGYQPRGKEKIWHHSKLYEFFEERGNLDHIWTTPRSYLRKKGAFELLQLALPDLAKRVSEKNRLTSLVEDRMKEDPRALQGLSITSAAAKLGVSQPWLRTRPGLIKKYKIRPGAGSGGSIHVDVPEHFKNPEFVQAFLASPLSGLTRKERKVLQGRILSEETTSQEEIGRELVGGVRTRARVQQIEAQALQKAEDFLTYQFKRGPINPDHLEKEPIQRLGYLGPRFWSRFEGLGIQTLQDLIQTSSEEFIGKNFGAGSLNDLVLRMALVNRLSGINLTLQGEGQPRAEVRMEGEIVLDFPGEKVTETLRKVLESAVTSIPHDPSFDPIQFKEARFRPRGGVRRPIELTQADLDLKLGRGLLTLRYDRDVAIVRDYVKLAQPAQALREEPKKKKKTSGLRRESKPAPVEPAPLPKLRNRAIRIQIERQDATKGTPVLHFEITFIAKPRSRRPLVSKIRFPAIDAKHLSEILNELYDPAVYQTAYQSSGGKKGEVFDVILLKTSEGKDTPVNIWDLRLLEKTLQKSLPLPNSVRLEKFQKSRAEVRAIPELIAALDSSPRKALRAASNLGKIAETFVQKQASGTMYPLLDSGNERKQIQALDLLSQKTPEFLESLAALTERLVKKSEGNERMRRQTAESLSKTDLAVAETILELGEAINSQHVKVRWKAVEVLRSDVVIQAMKEAASKLAVALESEGDFRDQIEDALKDLGAVIVTIIWLLIDHEMLKDTSKPSHQVGRKIEPAYQIIADTLEKLSAILLRIKDVLVKNNVHIEKTPLKARSAADELETSGALQFLKLKSIQKGAFRKVQLTLRRLHRVADIQKNRAEVRIETAHTALGRVIPSIYKRADKIEIDHKGIRFQYALIKETDYKTESVFQNRLQNSGGGFLHYSDRGIYYLFVDGDRIPANYRDIVAMHEYTESVFGISRDPIAILAELQFARLQKRLNDYLKWLSSNFPSRFEELKDISQKQKPQEILSWYGAYNKERFDDLMDRLDPYPNRERKELARTIFEMLKDFNWPRRLVTKKTGDEHRRAEVRSMNLAPEPRLEYGGILSDVGSTKGMNRDEYTLMRAGQKEVRRLMRESPQLQAHLKRIAQEFGYTEWYLNERGAGEDWNSRRGLVLSVKSFKSEEDLRWLKKQWQRQPKGGVFLVAVTSDFMRLISHSEDREALLEHELFHVMFNSAFPQFIRAATSLRNKMEGSFSKGSPQNRAYELILQTVLADNILHAWAIEQGYDESVARILKARTAPLDQLSQRLSRELKSDPYGQRPWRRRLEMTRILYRFLIAYDLAGRRPPQEEKVMDVAQKFFSPRQFEQFKKTRVELVRALQEEARPFSTLPSLNRLEKLFAWLRIPVVAHPHPRAEVRRAEVRGAARMEQKLAGWEGEAVGLLLATSRAEVREDVEAIVTKRVPASEQEIEDLTTQVQQALKPIQSQSEETPLLAEAGVRWKEEVMNQNPAVVSRAASVVFKPIYDLVTPIVSSKPRRVILRIQSGGGKQEFLGKLLKRMDSPEDQLFVMSQQKNSEHQALQSTAQKILAGIQKEAEVKFRNSIKEEEDIQQLYEGGRAKGMVVVVVTPPKAFHRIFNQVWHDSDEFPEVLRPDVDDLMAFLTVELPGILEDLQHKEGQERVAGLLLQLKERGVVVKTEKDAFTVTLDPQIVQQLLVEIKGLQAARASA